MKRIKANIKKVLNSKNYTPAALITSLKQIPILSNAFTKKANNIRKWTLEEHTLIVLNQLESYFLKISFPSLCDIKFLRLSIALHDIGKPFASELGNKKLQHKKSKEIFDEISNNIPFTFQQQKLFYSIFLNDLLGDFLRGKVELKETINRLKTSSDILNIDICTLLYINTIYYQCDVASYTLDALSDLEDKIGGKPLLDYIFYYNSENKKVFDANLKILMFSEDVERRYKQLLKKLKCHEST